MEKYGNIMKRLYFIIFLFVLLYMNYHILDTKYTNEINENKIWNEYPRPQLVRDSYINLNGFWDYKISKINNIPNKYDGKILVPFPIESKLSHVQKTLQNNDYLYYRRYFCLNKEFIKDIVILHFDAIDQISTIYLNGKELLTNEGGYIPFEIDITKYLNENNELIVKVIDNLDQKFPYGKQSKKRGGMWYTPISGIWQSVWIESVNKEYIKNIKITPNIDENEVKIIVNNINEILEVKINEEHDININNNEITIKIKQPILWFPDNPYLYKFDIITKYDNISSYFALRKISIGKRDDYSCIMLNNKPYYFNGLLDQGYYSDSIYLPATIQGYIDDIKQMKELGFNTLRKHIKIEPLLWYYLCDSIGMIVWQDMVNNSPYRFLHDTVFPTIAFRNLQGNAPKENQNIFINTMKSTINLLYNQPSIVLWTIFNEGWGQFNGDELYNILKLIDNTRIIDTASGWFKTRNTDVESLHTYFKKISINKSDKPIILSEFGGYSYKIKEHSFNLNKEYGYKFYKNKNDFNNAIYNLYFDEILPLLNKGLCGSIYTQLSDVEDETNGILTYDRKINKINNKDFINLLRSLKF